MCFITAGWPVCFFSNEADWALVAVTVISVIATTLLGYFAYKNGKRATEIAESAETARAQELEDSRKERTLVATRQEAFEYGLRLDDAIAEFVVASSKYVGELDAWRQECSDLEADMPGYGNPDLLPYPPKPLDHEVKSAVEIITLREKEKSVGYSFLYSAVRELLDANPKQFVELMPVLVSLTGQLRAREIDDSSFIKQAAELLKHAEHGKRPLFSDGVAID